MVTVILSLSAICVVVLLYTKELDERRDASEREELERLYRVAGRFGVTRGLR